jgi:hypothetical protein
MTLITQRAEELAAGRPARETVAQELAQVIKSDRGRRERRRAGVW